MNTKARLRKVKARPGGSSHHQAMTVKAPNPLAFCSMRPHVGTRGSPSPRKLRDASVRMALGILSTSAEKTKGITLGSIWVTMT